MYKTCFLGIMVMVGIMASWHQEQVEMLDGFTYACHAGNRGSILERACPLLSEGNRPESFLPLLTFLSVAAEFQTRMIAIGNGTYGVMIPPHSKVTYNLQRIASRSRLGSSTSPRDIVASFCDMSDRAQGRIEALRQQLQSSSSRTSLPPITRIAGNSSGPRVQGKVVIITGANSALGIGRASAHQFAENGARAIYICDESGSNLAAHKKEINAAYPGVDVHCWRFDAADEAQVKAVVDDALNRYGRLDVFFANAGITGSNVAFTDFTDAEFMDVLRINTLSVFLAAKYAAPAMMKTCSEKPRSCGSIIGTASVAGLRSNAGSTPYSASKAAVVSLAQTIAYQLAGSNVRVNAICPGLIETGMTAPIYEAARARGSDRKIGQLNPLRRGGQADEIARVALFLGSDESSYVNGQAWAVCGGLSAGHPHVPGNLA
ncbi:uncharacterized protein UV8b_06167 [Ustilaginoidea virens]|uniref:3-oxoacyl-(Acyl-carrier-protein) reductase n=1 Tax=Ustilaginoidea virens TaxID=1159556 RepID=A0A8E5HUS3_USTVR|nr:uncharacterized protein UV8b_06167 [Ustilaginoidea virens]QUC21926.1 hypothetical protein UV8b_06167 [Ustilaginoidea virens]